MELLHRRKAPRLGARGQALRRKARQPAPQKRSISRDQAIAPCCGKSGEIFKIRTVGQQRIARRAPFRGQHFQKGFNMA